jgi:hypothetical protein
MEDGWIEDCCEEMAQNARPFLTLFSLLNFMKRTIFMLTKKGVVGREDKFASLCS